MRQSDKTYGSVVVGGFRTISCTADELAELMLSDCLAGRSNLVSSLPKLVFSSNGQGIALAGRSPRFMYLMEQADIVHADGMPVVFASKLTGAPLPERIATTDFFHNAARLAEQSDLRFFMLGGTEALNLAAVQQIEVMYPQLSIVGRHHGFFGEEDDEKICTMVRESRADVLWVALGKPKQEEWCVRNRSRLQGVGWLKTCGGLYSFLTKDVARAPEWMQKSGLEWLFRASQDPGRLALRYLTTNPRAAYRLIRLTERPKAGKV